MQKNKPFWLIHLTSKVTVHVPDVVDLDELNEDLDQLLAKDGQ